MSMISAISGGQAWADINAARTAAQNKMQAQLFAKVDADGNGSVDQTELQTVLDKVSAKTGVAAGDVASLLSKMDGDGSGSLSSDELGQSLHSLLPPPSTMEFAQSRAGDAQSAHDKFAELDTDADGELSEAEFEAGRPQQGEGAAGGAGGPGGAGGVHAGGMPPPPPAGAGQDDSTAYDPLDTNKDGIVSAAELAAGNASVSDTTDVLQALFKAIDADGDNQISAGETKTLIDNIGAALQSLTQGASASSSDASGDGKAQRFDLAALTSLVLMQYEQVANGQSAQTTGSMLNATA